MWKHDGPIVGKRVVQAQANGILKRNAKLATAHRPYIAQQRTDGFYVRFRGRSAIEQMQVGLAQKQIHVSEAFAGVTEATKRQRYTNRHVFSLVVTFKKSV